LLQVIPMTIIVLGITATNFYANIYKDINDFSIVKVLAIGASLSILCGWLWWSYWVVSWKIEGLKKVKDAHLLYHRAVTGRLIWPKGHFYEKTEIKILRGRILAQLEKKLELPREKEWNIAPKLPKEYSIPVSRTGLYIGIALVVIAIILLIVSMNAIIPLCIVVFSGFGFWTYYNHRKKGAIFMRLSEETLEVNGLPIPWEDLEEFDFIVEGFGKDRNSYLQLKTNKNGFGTQRINLDRANASRIRIEYLMDVYHDRYLMNKQNRSQAS